MEVGIPNNFVFCFVIYLFFFFRPLRNGVTGVGGVWTYYEKYSTAKSELKYWDINLH